MPSPESPLAVAERLFSAIEAGDVPALRSIYAANAVIWHNNDNAEQTVDDNLRVLQWVVSHVRELRYENVRRQATEHGFVQQHVLRGIAPNGAALKIAACILCTVKEGRITRLDEYIDSASVAPLLAPAPK